MDPYLGEIRMFGGTFAPVNWAFCNGQLLSVAENEALFTLIGTTYGGDGISTFGLPNLQGRIPVHTASQYPLGQIAGTESVTLLTTQLPAHTHQALAMSTAADLASPANAVWAKLTTDCYSSGAAGGDLGTLNMGAMYMQGQGLPHDNMQPFLAVSFIIATAGIFPSQG